MNQRKYFSNAHILQLTPKKEARQTSERKSPESTETLQKYVSAPRPCIDGVCFRISAVAAQATE